MVKLKEDILHRVNDPHEGDWFNQGVLENAKTTIRVEKSHPRIESQSIACVQGSGGSPTVSVDMGDVSEPDQEWVCLCSPANMVPGYFYFPMEHATNEDILSSFLI